MATCPRCNSEVPEGAAACPTCGYTMGSGAPVVTGSNPWKNRSETGFFPALVETVKMVITNPMGFYSTLDKDGDWGSPILYAVIVGWVGAILSFVWTLIGPAMSMPFAGKAGMSGFAAMGTMMLVFAIFYPVFLLIGMFIWSGLLHLSSMVLGDGERGFEVTFKIVAYTVTTNLASIIPFCGGMLGGLWALVLTIIGIKAGHRTDTWKAVLAPLLIVILCCVCIGIAYAAGFAALVGAFHGAASMR